MSRFWTKHRASFLAVIVITLCGTSVAAAQTTPNATPVPRITGPIPVTADSFPLGAWNRTQEIIDLPKLGYTEEEFFVSGAANVYDWAADGSVSVKTANAPYTTRILVRRPTNPSRFSGNVIVQHADSGRGVERSFVWAISHDYFIEHGDAYVAISHAPAIVAAMKKFNAKRYAPLSLANPTPAQPCAPGANTDDSEEGLRWDIMSQVGALLKSNSPSGPMPGFKVEYLFATSHGGDLQTYINAIHPRAKLDNGKPVYDGYVIKSAAGPTRISRCGATPGASDPRQVIKNAGVPVIRTIAQADVFEGFALRRPDSDEPNDRFRLYEVAGAPHMDPSYYRNLPIAKDQAAVGETPALAYWPLPYQCDPVITMLELPAMGYTLNSSFANLDQWVRKGTPPPRAERVGVKDGGTPKAGFVTDQFGNAVGGVRSPYLDVPVATYHPSSAGEAICRQLGHEAPFGWARLEALYGTSKNYADKVTQAIDRLVRERWLTESDGRRIKAELITK